jgi:hypothetical protein
VTVTRTIFLAKAVGAVERRRGGEVRDDPENPHIDHMPLAFH